MLSPLAHTPRSSHQNLVAAATKAAPVGGLCASCGNCGNGTGIAPVLDGSTHAAALVPVNQDA